MVGKRWEGVFNMCEGDLKTSLNVDRQRMFEMTRQRTMLARSNTSLTRKNTFLASKAERATVIMEDRDITPL